MCILRYIITRTHTHSNSNYFAYGHLSTGWKCKGSGIVGESYLRRDCIEEDNSSRNLKELTSKGGLREGGTEGATGGPGRGESL